MIFSNLFFLYAFLPVCVALYFLAEGIAAKNFVLIVVSLTFYAWGRPLFVLLLLFSAAVNYFCALLIEKYRGDKRSKIYFIAALSYNLGALVFFKYTGFFIKNINSLFSLSIGAPKLILPLGISFYTFQITSYLIDCYWEKVTPQRSFPKLLLYISLFPQVTAGPIVRYTAVGDALSDRETSISDISAGATRFIVGLGKKVIVADTLSGLVKTLIGGPNIAAASFTATAAGVVCFALYVYYDFSGYSDMAIGLGRIFGFRYNENFNYPFISKSIAEFWQRWHISLGSFFRDYLLYVPIFGKRRKVFSLFLVWFCTGFWHGASWNFILWGLYFGVFILIEQLLGKKRLKAIPAFLSHLFSLLIIVIGFGIFYFENLTDLGNFFKNLVFANNNAFSSAAVNTALRENIYLILFAALFSLPVLNIFKRLKARIPKWAPVFDTAVILSNLFILAVSSVMLLGSTNNPFLYIKF